MYEDFFHQRLTRLRMEKGVSARDMSLSLGQSAGYINALENNRGYPSMQTFFYICEYFDITPMEFFDEDNGYPRQNRELIKDLSALNSEQLQHLTAIIKDMGRRR